MPHLEIALDGVDAVQIIIQSDRVLVQGSHAGPRCHSSRTSYAERVPGRTPCWHSAIAAPLNSCAPARSIIMKFEMAAEDTVHHLKPSDVAGPFTWSYLSSDSTVNPRRQSDLLRSNQTGSLACEYDFAMSRRDPRMTLTSAVRPGAHHFAESLSIE